MSLKTELGLCPKCHQPMEDCGIEVMCSNNECIRQTMKEIVQEMKEAEIRSRKREELKIIDGFCKKVKERARHYQSREETAIPQIGRALFDELEELRKQV